MLSTLFAVFLGFNLILAQTIIYDGRAPLNMTPSDLDTSTGPYLTAVKGSEDASFYTTFLGNSIAPTPLWNVTEQPISIIIDNSSIFIPGGGAPQNGFRRTELIAQSAEGSSPLDAAMEIGQSVFHFSVIADLEHPLNYTHEYQVVFIEPSDGTHVFELQLGSPFTNPTGSLPAVNATNLKILDHNLDVLFSTPFTSGNWHNFAVQVDWDALTLEVSYSTNGDALDAVTGVIANAGEVTGANGQGDFHFGVLKLPLVDPADTATEQNDVVHYGIQEGTTEGLIYSGVFVELL